MPGEDELKTLKESSRLPLHMVTVLGRVYVVRPILRPEWSQLQQQDDNIDKDVAVAERCVVWPKNTGFADVAAGIPLVLSRHILTISGFQDMGDVEEL
jgi:hypothetical protein